MTILGYHHFRKHPDGSIFGISKLYAHRFSEVAPSHLRSTSSPPVRGMLLQLPISRIWLYEWSSELHEERKPRSKLEDVWESWKIYVARSQFSSMCLEVLKFSSCSSGRCCRTQFIVRAPKKRDINCRFWGSEKSCYVFLTPFLIKALWACLPGTWPRQSHHINGCLGVYRWSDLNDVAFWVGAFNLVDASGRMRHRFL